MAWPTTSRHKRGYGIAHEKMRAHLRETVVLCEERTRRGRVAIGTIADHIKPLARGGTADRSNYQLLCQLCSDAKAIADRGAKAKSETGADGLSLDPNDPWRIAAGGG